MADQKLPTYDLQELAEPLLALFASAPEEFAQLVALQNLLLEGQPVSQERIAPLTCTFHERRFLPCCKAPNSMRMGTSWATD